MLLLYELSNGPAGSRVSLHREDLVCFCCCNRTSVDAGTMEGCVLSVQSLNLDARMSKVLASVTNIYDLAVQRLRAMQAAKSCPREDLDQRPSSCSYIGVSPLASSNCIVSCCWPCTDSSCGCTDCVYLLLGRGR